MSLESSHERDYYAANYRSYQAQNPGRKLDHYISAVESACSLQAPVLLDIGCGLGAFLNHAATQRPLWVLHGTDVRGDAVERAAQKLGHKARVATASAEVKPFGVAAFDVITAWDVLEHVDDPADAIANLASWLSPGGVLAFVVPVYDGPTGPIVSLLDKDPTHLHKVGRDFWVDLAEKNLSRVSWHGIFRYLITPGRYIHYSTRWARRLTPAILVSGRTDQR